VKKNLVSTNQDKKKSAEKVADAFFIVGIGTSAGGLEALSAFLDHTPPDTGMAFVIVQHLDPNHKSMLSELIGNHTAMCVTEASDGLVVVPNAVYTIPPNKTLKIFHKTLELSTPLEDQGKRKPIDTFFKSLAIDQKSRAIGIVLSGTGSDGTDGLKDIVTEGGLCIVQDPITAQFRGMPEHAIEASVADYILPPDKISKKLVEYTSKRTNNLVFLTTNLDTLTENQLKKICLIIRDQTGYDFLNYKSNTVVRRINKRIAMQQIESYEEYIDLLEKNPDEVVKLYKEFLIGVTSFFRDNEVFKSLENNVIPYLLEKCTDKQGIRVWVCGCSTGEEAYSIAMLFKEALYKFKKHLKVVIFASDIDEDAIEFGRNGTYSDNIRANVSHERIARFFQKKDNKYQIKKEIREMVVFAHHNVIKDPPFSKIDLITCRNLLIYLDSELQKKIIPTFHFRLNDGGILILGTSESIGEYVDLFSVFEDHQKIFKKNNVAFRKENLFYQLPPIERQAVFTESSQNFAGKKKTATPNVSEKILLEQYAPPSVIIDKNNDAIYFSGNTGQFLEPPNGFPRFNILDMAKKGLRSFLENSLKKARKNNIETRISGVDIMVNDQFYCINLIVKPLTNKEYELGTLMVIFEPVHKSDSKESTKTTSNASQSKRTNLDVERELKITREYLQTAINELETSNEERLSAFEEHQLSNEELQSTVEELETSREELQSVNEEMITVNNELTNKIEQLSQANNDLNNLLRSIEVVTLYLDPNLKIKRFTGAASEIFNLIPSDIDRPITQLSSNLVYYTLADDVNYALKTLSVKSMEVVSTDGKWYNMRIIPYRTAENIIEGVLVTLVDISEQKKIEKKMINVSKHLQLMADNMLAVPYSCTLLPILNIDFVGENCERLTGFLPEKFMGNMDFWIQRIHPSDRKKMLDTLSDTSKKGVSRQEFRFKCADNVYKKFVNTWWFSATNPEKPDHILGVWQT
jgi:two-component system CheB/CheR fusion protein